MDPEQRAAVADLWALGDYEQVGQRLRPAAVRLAAAAGDGRGRRALDVATGTGSVALELAGRGWVVSATDLCLPLLARGAAAAREAAHTLDWQEAPLDHQPYDDRTFSLVCSSFGLIFAPDPGATVAELRRCLAPRGVIAFTAWLPGGYMAEMTRVMQEFLPQSGRTGHDPLSWGDPRVVRNRLEGFTRVEVTSEELPWHFSSAEEAISLYFEHSPAHVASARAAGEAAGDLRAAVHEHLVAHAGTDGAIDLAVEYAIVTAARE